MKRHGGKLMHLTKWKKAIWKATHCMIPITWHPGKGKTTERIKDQWLPGLSGEGWTVRAQRTLRPWSYSIWHYRRRVIANLPKPIECTTWPLLQTMDFQWLWCVSIGLSIVTNIPPWCGAVDNGGSFVVWRQGYMYLSLHFAVNLKLLLKCY